MRPAASLRPREPAGTSPASNPNALSPRQLRADSLKRGVSPAPSVQPLTRRGDSVRQLGCAGPQVIRKTRDSMADDMSMNPTREDFSALLDESLGGRDFMEGQVVQGKVVAIEKDIAIIDVGLKTEGRVSLKEFGEEEGKPPIKVGDTVEV